MSATGKDRKGGGNLPAFMKSLVQEHGARASGWREMTSGPLRVRMPFAFGGKKLFNLGRIPQKAGSRTREVGCKS